jgi:hypothetical protein
MAADVLTTLVSIRRFGSAQGFVVVDIETAFPGFSDGGMVAASGMHNV